MVLDELDAMEVREAIQWSQARRLPFALVDVAGSPGVAWPEVWGFLGLGGCSNSWLDVLSALAGIHVACAKIRRGWKTGFNNGAVITWGELLSIAPHIPGQPGRQLRRMMKGTPAPL